jgi:hypothetical protein
MRGIFILSREVLAEIPEGIYYEQSTITFCLASWRWGSRSNGHPSEDYTRDMGTWERYREVEAVYASLRPEERGLDG